MADVAAQLLLLLVLMLRKASSLPCHGVVEVTALQQITV
jgi:hypothetical protein